MSKEQLVDAYLRGEISRRAFIRRLVAGGVSVSAAVAYSFLTPQRTRASPGSYNLADEIEPTPAVPSPPQPNFGPTPRHTPPAVTLDVARARRGVQATVSSDEAASFVVAAIAGRKTLASSTFNLRSAGARTVTLRLPRRSPRRVKVVARATDGAGQSSSVQTSLNVR